MSCTLTCAKALCQQIAATLHQLLWAAVHQLDEPTSLALQAADKLEGKLLPHMGPRAQSLNIRHATLSSLSPSAQPPSSQAQGSDLRTHEACSGLV